MASGSLIPRVYSGFRGVDFRGEEINLIRSPDALNMWKDYKKTDSISTRPEMFRPWSDYGATIYGIYCYQKKGSYIQRLILHVGDKLMDEASRVICEVAARKSSAFIQNDMWYFKDGTNYLKYDGTTIKEVEGYVPTTLINRNISKDGIPGSGGATKQDVNMLSPYRWNTFIWDGSDDVDECHLDATNVVSVEEIKLFENGKWVGVSNSVYQLDNANGIVRFTSRVLDSAKTPEGIECVQIKYKVDNTDERKKIDNCTLLQVFDNRVFFSGNPYYPNVVWHSSLNDPTYCSDLDRYNDGTDSSRVMAMVAGNEALWVFKEPSQENTTVFYHRPTIDAEYGKVYPSSHSSITTGCVGRAINFNDDIVFFSERGMEAVSGDITTEQFLSHRSSLVDRKLTSESDYRSMVLAEWEGYLFVFIGNKVFLADSRAMFQNETHNEYEWFYWELPGNVTCANVFDYEFNDKVDTRLWVAMDNELWVFSLEDLGWPEHSREGDRTSYWVTPKDKFGYPQYLKTTNKRGCAVEATGEEISVYAKTEKDGGFTDDTFIGKYENVTDYFISRIKRKKFKDIQLKFASNKPFSLEMATLECFIGGYIKR